ncbi:MAG: MBL fold metallo-hydrolase [Halieaceae bacterium]|nr:MBL fold metallo-hydrolase [Halieaceae bacterium]
MSFATVSCTTQPADFYEFDAVCANLPNEVNRTLPLSDASDAWFQVYHTGEGVYSIVEPYHVQGAISHLIIGTDRALMFDTGIGLLPIRPVVERITSLPVTVINSHTHYDHVGGNAEFDDVRAIDTAYTRRNMRGFSHARIGADFSADSFCHGPPSQVAAALETIQTRPWQATGYIYNGDVIDLGGRRIEVFHIPGHTPDAVALLDRKNQLLFTGDTFYDDEIWLFVPETSLDDYEASLERLVAIESEVRFLYGAHTSARVPSGRLAQLLSAFKTMRAGEYSGTLHPHGPSLLRVDNVEFMTSRQALEGVPADTSRGGSGLDVWR